MPDMIAFLEPKASILARRDAIVTDLEDLLPKGCLISEPRGLVPFETDAFVSYRRVPLAVALPETTAQVSALLKYCNRYDIPVIPRGAGTSLCGGAIPQ